MTQVAENPVNVGLVSAPSAPTASADSSSAFAGGLGSVFDAISGASAPALEHYAGIPINELGVIGQGAADPFGVAGAILSGGLAAQDFADGQDQQGAGEIGSVVGSYLGGLAGGAAGGPFALLTGAAGAEFGGILGYYAGEGSEYVATHATPDAALAAEIGAPAPIDYNFGSSGPVSTPATSSNPVTSPQNNPVTSNTGGTFVNTPTNSAAYSTLNSGSNPASSTPVSSPMSSNPVTSNVGGTFVNSPTNATAYSTLNSGASYGNYGGSSINMGNYGGSGLS